MIHIIEIKARCANQEAIRSILIEHGAHFRGVDHQIDTYFQVPKGRLKLREGRLENALIHYARPNNAGPKRSDVHLYRPQPDAALKPLLTAALGILTVVDKQREIYFIDNVKFHLDRVETLGTFVEIEAIDPEGTIGIERLDAQCTHYLNLFNIATADLIAVSYSDLLLDAPAQS